MLASEGATVGKREGKVAIITGAAHVIDGGLLAVVLVGGDS